MNFITRLFILILNVFLIAGYSHSIPTVHPYSRPSSGLGQLPSATGTPSDAVPSLPYTPLPPISIGPTRVYTNVLDASGNQLHWPISHFQATYTWNLSDGTETDVHGYCTTTNSRIWDCNSPPIIGSYAILNIEASTEFNGVTYHGSGSVTGGAPYTLVLLRRVSPPATPTPTPTPTATPSY